VRASLPARLWRRVRAHLREDTWCVGIVAKPAHAFLSDPQPSPVRWIELFPDDGFYADPFPFVSDGRLKLLVEGYDYTGGQGYIAQLDPDGPADKRVTRLELPVPHHLSYPYLIEQDGQTFCVPESHQARRVVLLRGDPFPSRWVEDTVLLQNYAGVDSTPFEHDGRWWLFCADNDRRDQKLLFVFFSDSLRGPWRPHAGNPVKASRRSARPGGRPFVHNGALYRPAQDCTRTYGGAIVLNRVLELSPERFAEEEAVRIEPDPSSPYPDGLHHFVPFGDLTVIDAKRERFDAFTATRWLSRQIRTRSGH
jgi:hypothetical protein